MKRLTPRPHERSQIMATIGEIVRRETGFRLTDQEFEDLSGWLDRALTKVVRDRDIDGLDGIPTRDPVPSPEGPEPFPFPPNSSHVLADQGPERRRMIIISPGAGSPRVCGWPD